MPLAARVGARCRRRGTRATGRKVEPRGASGIYDAQLTLRQGGVERRDFAVNVPAAKATSRSTGREDLTRQLAGVDYQLHDAADMAVDRQQLAGFQMGDALLGALIVMLLVEQLLAYLASYHIRP